MTKQYHISFDGYVTIDADTIEQAEEKFWKGLTCITTEGYDDYYDINLIESDEGEIKKGDRNDV